MVINTEHSRPRYNDRRHAGFELAEDLRRTLEGQDPIVLAIPRGGVPVASGIAEGLKVSLDLIIPRRIEAPGQPDVTLGAITPDRTLVINKAVVANLNLSDEEIEQLSIPVWAEVQRAQQVYRMGRPYPDLKGRTVLVVDDRLITGYTMIAAVMSVRKMEPARVVAATPVAYIEGLERVRGYVDELLSLEVATSPALMLSRYYADTTPLTDREVIWTLERFWSERPPSEYSETF
jgi:putative phosphoribosyl transferase